MRIAYKKSFDKKFKKLPEKIKQRFYERLAVFILDPFESQLNNHSVDPTYPCCRSINITGDYRALYHDIDGTITFVIIGRHSELYS